MNEFRQALDAHLEGRLDCAALEKELNLGLARAPHLAAAHGALVEASYRSGRIKGDTYHTLIQVIRAFQQRQPKVSVHVTPVRPPPPAGAAADKTQFRAPKPATQDTTPPASADGEKTQFRAPRAARAASAESSGANGAAAGNAGAASAAP